jgi:hypothetical protein
MKYKIYHSVLVGYLVFSIALLCGIPVWNHGFALSNPDASDLGAMVTILNYITLDMIESYLSSKEPKKEVIPTEQTRSTDYVTLLNRLENSDDEKINTLLTDWFYFIAGYPNRGSSILPDGRSWSQVNGCFTKLITEGSYVSAVLLMLPDEYEVKLEVNPDDPSDRKFYLKNKINGEIINSDIESGSLSLAECILKIKGA